MTQHLINSSKSSRGWSYYSNYFKCPRLWAYERIAHIDLGSADPLLRGSMGHVGLAHFFARAGARQSNGFVYGTERITDPDFFYDPFTAMELWGKENGASKFLDQCIDTLEHWLATNSSSIDEVVGVEQEYKSILGTLDGRWGMWVVKIVDDEYIYTDPNTNTKIKVEPTLLDCPGHVDHNSPIFLSRRFDLIVRRLADRKVYIDDHKITSSDTSGFREEEYRLDGQFSAVRIFGRQLWGAEFGGARLNLVRCVTPWNSKLHFLQPTDLDNSFADDIWTKINRMSRDTLEIPDAFQWEAARNEGVCAGRYGLCSAYSLCHMGKSGIVNGVALRPHKH